LEIADRHPREVPLDERLVHRADAAHRDENRGRHNKRGDQDGRSYEARDSGEAMRMDGMRFFVVTSFVIGIMRMRDRRCLTVSIDVNCRRISGPAVE